jgi:hypothetical protein
MRANAAFQGLDKSFWAHVRSLSQTIGYTARGTNAVKAPTLTEIHNGMGKLGLLSDHLLQGSKPTAFAQKLLDYFTFRAGVLNNTVQQQLMVAAEAKALYEKLLENQKYKIAATMNKQTGDKRQVAYLTAIVNMLIESNSDGLTYAHDPQKLTTVTKDGRPLRTLSRRVDGAFPSTVNPAAIWEIKEYYYTTTFGSRIADGVYETLLDGLELEEMRLETGVAIEHILIVDAKPTWWSSQGRGYLCRMIDMLHMGYVSEVLFGREVELRLPDLVRDWARTTRARQAVATTVLPDQTPLF